MDARLMLSALGVPIDLTFVGPRAAEIRAALASRWTLCTREHPVDDAYVIEVAYGARPRHDLATPQVTGTDLAKLMVEVTHQVTLAAIEASVGSLLMFHAAGISSQRTGACVVAVAPGRAGKTTICRTLAPGRGYVSDESIGVAADGTILPYPKPLSVRRPHEESKDEIEPARYGLTPCVSAPYVAGILLLERSSDGPDQPVVEELDVFDAITGVIPETSSLSRLPRPLHRLAELMESTSLLARVQYREATSLEPVIADVIGAPLAASGAGRVGARS